MLTRDKVAVAQEPIKYCLYARKSMEQEDKQALSIDSQVKEMLELAGRDNLNVVEIKREAHSSKKQVNVQCITSLFLKLALGSSTVF